MDKTYLGSKLQCSNFRVIANHSDKEEKDKKRYKKQKKFLALNKNANLIIPIAFNQIGQIIRSEKPFRKIETRKPCKRLNFHKNAFS